MERGGDDDWDDVLEQQVQGVAQGEDRVVEQNLVLVEAADDVDHDVRLELVEYDPVVVEDDVARLLGRLVDEALFKGLLRLEVRVGVGRGARADCVDAVCVSTRTICRLRPAMPAMRLFARACEAMGNRGVVGRPSSS